MEHDLAADMTLDGIARAVGLSAKQFTRSFRQSIGLPPHRWLLRRRIERARELLAQTEISIAEIALACDFADQSHFTASFRKAARVTHGAFRRVVRI